MSHQPDDNLNKELDRLEREYRALPGDQPPAMLDQAVLNRARREVEPPPGRRPWSFGWVHGLTSAAVVVLGVALFLQAPETPERGPMRVAKPPSSKLRDIESEIKPLRIPARQQAAPGAPPTLAREISRPKAVEDQAEPAKLNSSAQLLEEASVGESELDITEPAAEARRETLSDAAQKSETDASSTAPDIWVERLLELKRAGQDEELARELAAFRAAWPDHPLPSELAE